MQATTFRWGDTDLKSRLEAAARANHRSLHGEIMERLARSFDPPDVGRPDERVVMVPVAPRQLPAAPVPQTPTLPQAPSGKRSFAPDPK